ncbi:hypothetical protein ANCCEY_12701 [Ancylostoma ceylanicum]|uniref:Uncharacterized protein n=1 Tax=Ancylostoma ceylanicum TaxID=53326 RepID=A0A0D6L8M9_9BILA|nr:hypothetical protein ANCCEY_12701 [Ancylostoma ceylanicum]
MPNLRKPLLSSTLDPVSQLTVALLSKLSIAQTLHGPDYCTYVYVFPQGTCEGISQEQGSAYIGTTTKWLEETWEERVRKAAADLNVQGGTGTAPSKNSRAGRKALKQSTLKSKEGSKEIGSKEIGSKEGSRDFGSRDKMSNEGDELFPAAVGPNDPRGGAGYGGYSNEGPNRGGAGYGGYSNEGPHRGGAGYGGGYSNEGANRGGAGYGGYPNAGANMPNANAPNMW